MKKIRYASALLLSLAFSLVGSTVYGTFEDESMRGIDSIYIAIENINPHIRNEGFNEQTVRGDVALKVRSAGIKIVGENEWLSSKGRPYLLITPIVNVIIRGNFLYNWRYQFKRSSLFTDNANCKGNFPE